MTRLERGEKKTIALTKVFHGKIPEVTQLDPFVLQGGLEQGVVLKDVVICPSGGEGWGRGGDLFSRGTRPRQREKEKLLQNNRSVAAYKCTVITQWCWCYKRWAETHPVSTTLALKSRNALWGRRCFTCGNNAVITKRSKLWPPQQHLLEVLKLCRITVGAPGPETWQEVVQLGPGGFHLRQ